MRLRNRPPLLYSLLLLSVFLIIVPPTHAARNSATSFCKCICFNNSTIIALNPPTASSATSERQNVGLLAHRDQDAPAPPKQHQHKLTCADCTRAFCLDYNLPICKNAREEDVFTTCFQRDSIKDETVVIIFLILTTGLLGWALIKPWIDRLRERSAGREYVPVQQDQGQGHPPSRVRRGAEGGVGSSPPGPVTAEGGGGAAASEASTSGPAGQGRIPDQ